MNAQTPSNQGVLRAKYSIIINILLRLSFDNIFANYLWCGIKDEKVSFVA